VWFTKPVDAHRDCPQCKGNVRLWMRGDDVLRVTARKDQWGEVEEWICNECRFEKKHVNDWVIEGPTRLNRLSVINAGHYEKVERPKELMKELMGQDPRFLLDIKTITDVNQVDLNEINGPATGATFNGNPEAVGVNVTDVKEGKGRNLAGTDSTNPVTP
jgi:NADH-quinone oxidoreductase subunit G